MAWFRSASKPASAPTFVFDLSTDGISAAVVMPPTGDQPKTRWHHRVLILKLNRMTAAC